MDEAQRTTLMLDAATTMSEKLALSVDEAADAVGISRAKLYETWADGTGPPQLKVGRRTLVPRDGLKKWLAERTDATDADDTGEAE